jgi:methylamine methyltransferase corrinoid activation protein
MVLRLGIGFDLGTSGFRAQSIDLNTGKILSTAITLRHPVPGANVMDHLHFAVEVSEDVANALMLDTISTLFEQLDVNLEEVERAAVCGNPIQLSIFQNIEIRDLAWAGKKKLELEGVVPPSRNAKILKASDLKLNINPDADVIIPPAIRHEIGADALAMMFKSGFLETKEIALVTDFGTNAEIALKVDGDIYSGSAAAGPAIEGQHIEDGMLAAPGAISDLQQEGAYYRCIVLDENILAQKGDLINISVGKVIEEGPMHGKAKGVTGTGVIAAIAYGLDSGLIKLPKIDTSDKILHLQDGVRITEKDVLEAGKALGAFRAGHITLVEEAGITLNDVNEMYMCGAAGTYVDAVKSKMVGQIPATSERIYQLGNTSLAMAVDLVRDPSLLDRLQKIADEMRAKHVMFATAPVFEFAYLQELAYWDEGMPFQMYNQMLKFKKIQEIPPPSKTTKIEKKLKRDIPDVGEMGLRVLREIGVTLVAEFEGCTECEKCAEECPEDAIFYDFPKIFVLSDLCDGSACVRCEKVCPEHVFNFHMLEHSVEKIAKKMEVTQAKT